MTRVKIQFYVLSIAIVLAIVIVAYVVTRITDHEAIYQTIRDVAPLLLGVSGALLADALQRRGRFLTSLREEWHNIVESKSALTAYCERARNDVDRFLDAFHVLSETIDSLRVVYRNVGETAETIGYYPYEPLHDMRRYFEAIDPRRHEATPEQFRIAQSQIVESFLALREVFLDEIDIAAPTHPILHRDARRTKKPNPPKA